MTIASTSGSDPRWKTIRDQLRTELAQYSYGSRFYTIAEICRTFEVSSITAIRSLNELANEGLIEKIPRKGHVVRQMPQQEKVCVRLVLPATKDLPHGDVGREPVIQRTVTGITQAAQQHGVEFQTISESHLPGLFPRAGEPCGFLVRRLVSHHTLRFLRAHNLPHVLIDPFLGHKGKPHAALDRLQAGYIAGQHLIALGHKRIAWITGPISSPNFRQRLKGYRHALREAGIPFRWSLIKESGPQERHRDEDMLDELLVMPKPPTAIIAGDDSRAIHILEACRRRGIAVPDEISILGYPNYPESCLTDPPLSVVDGCYESVGEAGLKLLLEQISQQAEPGTQRTMIEPTLIPRSSTAPPCQRHDRSINRADGASQPQEPVAT